MGKHLLGCGAADDGVVHVCCRLFLCNSCFDPHPFRLSQSASPRADVISYAEGLVSDAEVEIDALRGDIAAAQVRCAC